ncbi:bifunctional folylpolyglutamate synthase/dihydrofolate synthase [Natranaerofaba carboxydovora]|uniref:bifunctional folylpolyglutamate synthase/dihydrofolate synthase n=1 Tax=Natranaerofaba carboxydovora TaxID=2742683 RepID=UPI001F146364|nr:folylpolyglutamate synthase/dihydrofolate synthase family protein [Natranaerofaba carboxydovora]UMZ72844.1 Folylpolyglutamate synthase [Natranaerofaba carboxydovora]
MGDEIYKSSNTGVEWILSLGKFGQKPGLSRVDYIMDKLGNPQDEVKYIHIGGTNGKGSTSSYIASILKETGYKVGLFTSPFMERFNERFRINDKDIPDEVLERLIEEVKPIAMDKNLHEKHGHPTQFEIVTAIAFLYFAREKVDFVVLEVGLGGRLDSTNIITPTLSVITNIGLEHTDVLGDSVEEIAAEKAGIIKENVPVVTAIEDENALKVIEDKAMEENSKVYKIREDFSYEYIESNLEGQLFDYKGINGREMDSLKINLLGSHQMKNASLAVATVEALKVLGFDIPLIYIREGLKKAKCPGRMEILNDEPFILLDASHNLEGIRCLGNEIRKNLSPYKDIILLIGVLADKEVEKMLAEILPVATYVIFTTPDNPRAKTPGDLVEYALEYVSEENIIVEENIDKAVDMAMGFIEGKNSELALVCCGSFFVVSPVRNCLKNNH